MKAGGSVGLFGTSIETLRQRGDVAALLNVLEANKGRTQRRAFNALCELDDASIDALCDEMLAVYPFRAFTAATALGAIAGRGSMAAKQALLDYIRDARHPLVAGAALDALKDEKDENQAPYLSEHEQGDILPGLVDATLTFLGGPACLLETPRDPDIFDRMPARRTTRQILDGMREAHLEPRSVQLLAAFKILEYTEDPRAVSYLARAVTWEDPTYAAHIAAVVASGHLEIGSPFHLADSGVRKAAVKTLGTIYDSDSVAALIPALSDQSHYVRLAAVASLREVTLSTDGAATMAAFKRLVQVPDSGFPSRSDNPNDSQAAELRAVTCEAIARNSWADDWALLNELLASENPLIRRAANEGLRRYEEGPTAAT